MQNYKRHLFIVFITLAYVWGCDSITNFEDPIIDQEVLINADLVDQRLVFDTKLQLNSDVNTLKNLSRETFEEVLSKKYQSGFIPAVPIVNDSDIKTIDMLESKIRAEKSWKMKSSTETQESSVEFDDIISDEAFASLINSDGEIQVGDSVYKYTDLGLFFVHKDQVEHLYNYLESISNHQKVANVFSSTLAINPIDCEGPVLMSVDDQISYFGLIEEDCGPTGGSTGNPPNNGGNKTADEFIANLESCDTANGVFSFAFGTSKHCTDNFNNSDYRIKTKYWNQHYLLGRSIGISVKHQRKRLGIWWTISTWEIRLGINHVYFEYTVPNLSLDSVPKEVFYYNNNAFSNTGAYLSNQPLQLPFGTDLAIQIDLTKYGLGSNEVTPQDLFKLAQKTLIPMGKNFLKDNFSTDLKGMTIFGLHNNKIVYTYVNESRSKSDAKDIKKMFDFQFQIGAKYGTNGTSGFQFQNINLPNLYSYDEASIDIYGIGRRNSEWAGSRLIYN